MEMIKGKSKNPFQEWVKAGMDHLQEQIERLQQALSKNVQRETWIKWEGNIYNLTHAHIVCLESHNSTIKLEFPKETITLSVSRNTHILKLAEQIGDKAIKDAAEVVFGWIQKSIIECGGGILDVEQNLNQLQLKGEKPVELTKEMEIDHPTDEEIEDELIDQDIQHQEEEARGEG